MALLLAVLVLNSPAAADSFMLSAEQVQLDDTGLDRKCVGKLSWRGGLVLTSPDRDPRFEELSALLVSDDGLRLTSVTDDGYWVTMGLVYDLKGHLSDVKDGKIGRLRGLDGEYIAKETDGNWDEDKVGDAESLTLWDAESLARWDAESLARSDEGSLACSDEGSLARSDAGSLARSDTEPLAVAFEKNHRILHYSDGIKATATKCLKLPAFEPPKNKSNEGVEALVTLRNGALLAFIEGQEDTKKSLAYIQDHGKWEPLSYLHDRGFRPTGATRLPNGDVLVIERCYNFEPCDGNKTIVRLRRLKADSIVPGAKLKGEEIAELKDPFVVDNFEGVAMRATSRETLVYLLSDDNGRSYELDVNKKPKQRTLLLMFALEDCRE